MSQPSHTRGDWPWIAGKNELIRLVAARHHEAVHALAGLTGQEPNLASWSELLAASDRVLESVGREVAAATTRDEVEAARLRLSVHSESRDEMINALLGVAHRVLCRPPFEDDDWLASSWMVGYGRQRPDAEMQIIMPSEWEAGTPDWNSWRLSVAGGLTFHGVKLVNMADASVEIIETILRDLDPHRAGQPSAPRGAAPQSEFDRWYEERAKNWPPDSPGPSREADENAARAAFGDRFNRPRFRLARDHFAPASWKKPGAPKGRRKTGQ